MRFFPASPYISCLSLRVPIYPADASSSKRKPKAHVNESMKQQCLHLSDSPVLPRSPHLVQPPSTIINFKEATGKYLQNADVLQLRQSGPFS